MSLPLRVLLGMLVILLGALPPAIASALWHPARPVASETDALGQTAFLRDLLEDPAPIRWVDARDQEAFNAAHVPGAFHLSPGNWNEASGPFFLTLQPGDRVVIYCGDSNCGASREVANRLRNELGVANVTVLSGGWEAIENFGLEHFEE